MFCLALWMNTILFAQVGSDFYKKGNECFAKKDFKGAVAAYSKAIEQNPKNEDYFYKRGLAYLELNKSQSAFEDFTMGIKINSFSAKIYIERAYLLHKAQMIDEALADYTMAINYAKVDSIRKSAMSNRGTIRHLKLDYEGAYEDSYKVYLMDTTSLDGMNNLATVLDDLNRKDEAIAMLKRMIKQDTTYVGGYLNLAFQLSKSGKYVEAAPYFEKCVQLAPKMAYNYNNRGYNRLKLGDIDGALKDINYSIKLDPNNSWAYKNRGLAYIEQGKKEKACVEFNKSIELGYSRQYGPEVEELIKKNCGNGN